MVVEVCLQDYYIIITSYSDELEISQEGFVWPHPPVDSPVVPPQVSLLCSSAIRERFLHISSSLSTQSCLIWQRGGGILNNI